MIHTGGLVNNSFCLKLIYTYLIFVKQVFFQNPSLIDLNLFLLSCVSYTRSEMYQNVGKFIFTDIV